jgi:hypothetical protein
MKTEPVRDAQQTNQCEKNFPCDCGRCYSRPLQVHIKEHKYNLTQGLLEKSEFAQHAHEEGKEIYIYIYRERERESPTPHAGNTRNQPTSL